MPAVRHHHAVQPVVLIIGCPEPARSSKPPKYSREQRQPWNPQRAIPTRRSKAEAAKRLLDNINRQDAEVRAFMSESKRSCSHG